MNKVAEKIRESLKPHHVGGFTAICIPMPTLQQVDQLIAEVERLTAENVELKAAADPFVRATRLQDPLGLQDEMPVGEWIPGTWPTMRDARRLVKAAEAVRP